MKTTDDRSRYGRFRNEVMAGGSVTEAPPAETESGGWTGALAGLLIVGLLVWLAVVNLWMFIFAVGILLMVAILWVFRRAHPGVVQRRFRVAQLVSASFMAFSHGSNDAQKTMGVITLALFAAGEIPTADVPLWVKLASAIVIGLGTY